jgi:hypothetical protein
MKVKRNLLALIVLSMMLTLVVASAASAGEPPLPSVSGGVGFSNGDFKSFVAFSAKATGPATAGEEHQPGRGSLICFDDSGLAFTVSVEDIHAHSAKEVHFGGIITRSTDPSLVGMFAHAVAIDGGSPGRRGDQFSILVTDSDIHEHGVPTPVLLGNLVVKTL